MGKTLKYVKEFDFGPQRTHVQGYCRGGPMKKAQGGPVSAPAATSRRPPTPTTPRQSPLSAMTARSAVPDRSARPAADSARRVAQAKQMRVQADLQNRETAAARQHAASQTAPARETYKRGGKVSAPAFNSRPKVGGSCKW